MRERVPTIIEDEKRNGVWAGPIFISGFLDDGSCVRCGARRVYSDACDAYFCPACNRWLEHACTDSVCSYCVGRSAKPIRTSDETTPDEYIHALRTLWPEDQAASESLLVLVDEAVNNHPMAAQLWCIRGDLIQLGPESCRYGLQDALRSYERAAEIDPRLFEAWESIGFFHDVHTQDFAQAEEAFRRAISLGGGPVSWVGLARVVAERTSSIEAAFRVLEHSPYQDHEMIQQIRTEIAAGQWS